MSKVSTHVRRNEMKCYEVFEFGPDEPWKAFYGL